MDITARVLGFVFAMLGTVLVTQCFYEADTNNAVVAAFGVTSVLVGFLLVIIE